MPETPNNLRKSGIDIIGEVPWGTHFCQFYQTKADLLDILVPYFKAGLEAGEAGMWVTSAPLTVRDARAALKKAMPDLPKYFTSGQMEIVPYTDWYMKDGYFDLDRVLDGWAEKHDRARARGFGGLRVTGNTAWLERKDWDGFAEYEAAINGVIGKYNLVALCTYSLEACSATDVMDVIRNHEFALMRKEGKWSLIENVAYKQARKELKESEAELATILANIPMLVLVVDGERRVLKVNDAAARFAGRSPEDVVGLRAGEALCCLHSLDDPKGCGFGTHCQTCQTRLAVRDTFETGNNHYNVERSLPVVRDGKTEEVTLLLSTVRLEAAEKRVLVCIEDITERKRAEEALLRSRERFQILSEANSLLLTSERPERIVRTVAARVMEHLKCDVFFNFIIDEAKGRLRLNAFAGIPAEAAVDIEWLDFGVAICGCAARDGQRIISENVQENGDERASLVRSFGVKAYACHPLHIGEKTIGTLSFGSRQRPSFTNEELDLMRTVAEQVSVAMQRKLAEDGLRETRDYLENLLNYANAPIIVWDPEFSITRFNHAFERLTGIRGEDALGKKLDILFPEDSRQHSMEHIRSASTGQRMEVEEIPILHNDGSVRTVLWNSATLYEPDGKSAMATIAQGQDITERKKVEEALRRNEADLSTILTNVPLLLLVVDSERHVLRSNTALARFTGRTYAEVVGLRSGAALRCVHSMDDERGCGFGPHCLNCKSRLTLQDTFATGNNHHQVEWQMTFADGGGKTGEVTFLLSTIRLATAGEQVLVCIEDITERKRAEEEIRLLNDDLRKRALELEAVNRELEVFSYSVSHDLRAPLRTMAGFSQAVLEDYTDKLDDQGRDFLRRIQAGSQNMAQLIDDLLELSRVIRAEIIWGTVDLSEMAHQVADDLKRNEPERRVEVDIASGLQCYGDRHLLRLVLDNLFGNAWKFTSRRTSARIEFGASKENDGTVYFVRDNGAGFDMAYADKLFKPFQRLHPASQFAGSGIGLATVQRIVNRLGGNVWAEGEVDRGATLYFTLSENRK